MVALGHPLSTPTQPKTCLCFRVRPLKLVVRFSFSKASVRGFLLGAGRGLSPSGLKVVRSNLSELELAVLIRKV